MRASEFNPIPEVFEPELSDDEWDFLEELEEILTDNSDADATPSPTAKRLLTKMIQILKRRGIEQCARYYLENHTRELDWLMGYMWVTHGFDPEELARTISDNNDL